MEISLKNKVAVVTGATSGIGLSIAETFGEAGAKVAICSRNSDKVEETLGYLKSKDIDCYGKSVDVSNKDSLFQFADDVEKIYGGIDIWVSNAGIFTPYKLIDTPEEVWQKAIDVNLTSVYYGGLIAYDKLRKRGGGVLINAASFTSLIPSVGSGAYGVTKGAIYNMTKTLAAELAPYNIRVNGYIPGMIETAMTEDLINIKRKDLEQQIALQRLGTSQEVANGVLFLASEQASYVTGSCIEIHGGKICVQNPQDAWA